MLTGMLVAVFLFLSGIWLSSGPALADEGEDAMSGATTVLSTDAEASSVEASEEFAEEAVSALSTAAVHELSEETTESVEDTKLPVTVDMEDLSEHFTSGYGLDWYLFPTGPDGEWVYGEWTFIDADGNEITYVPWGYPGDEVTLTYTFTPRDSAYETVTGEGTFILTQWLIWAEISLISGNSGEGVESGTLLDSIFAVYGIDYYLYSREDVTITLTGTWYWTDEDGNVIDSVVGEPGTRVWVYVHFTPDDPNYKSDYFGFTILILDDTADGTGDVTGSASGSSADNENGSDSGSANGSESGVGSGGSAGSVYGADELAETGFSSSLFVVAGLALLAGLGGLAMPFRKHS